MMSSELSSANRVRECVLSRRHGSVGSPERLMDIHEGRTHREVVEDASGLTAATGVVFGGRRLKNS